MHLSTHLIPFLLAIVAAVGGFLFSRRNNGEPNQLVSGLLYAVAIGCVVIGFATWRLST